jgi:hypothetical protein
LRNFSSLLLIIIIFSIGIIYSGCGASFDKEDKSELPEEIKSKTKIGESGSEKILSAAKEEQGKEMYFPEVDSTYLYWLNNQLIILNGSTKCNIFVLNVLYKCGFKTPDENALASDLFDTTKFAEILPVIGINDISNVKKGDIIVWYNHVIIFESQVEIENELYAFAYWAGTNQEDNGENIKNNVCYGKYKLNGNYIVRRPVKK